MEIVFTSKVSPSDLLTLCSLLPVRARFEILCSFGSAVSEVPCDVAGEADQVSSLFSPCCGQRCCSVGGAHSGSACFTVTNNAITK